MLLTTDSHKTYSVHERWMIKRDMPEVMNIEDESFEYPWNIDDFAEYLRPDNCTGMVAVDNADENKVLGFMIYKWEYKNRIHLLNFAVSPEYWKKDIGTQMINELKRKLSLQRRNKLCLEVSERNLRAQLFFRSQGFRALSVFRGYYADTTEDAYLMECRYESFQEKPAVYSTSKSIDSLVA